MASNDYYEQWKPLRNTLKDLDLNETLGVIRAYASWQTFNTRTVFPGDIEVHPVVYSDKRTILPWEMEILAREAIIVTDNVAHPSKSARKWAIFSKLINKLRFVDDSIAKNYISNENILQEVTVRLAHQQFKYQSNIPNKAYLIRYSRIFNHPDVAPFVLAKTYLSPKQLFTIGSGLWLMYAREHLGVYYPLENLEVGGISQEDYDAFMALYSLPLSELKQRLTDGRLLDDTFKYQFHELQNHPIIYTQLNGRDAHICPIPTLLFWRVTSGLFFDLVKIKGFGLAFGKSFEEYTGEVLRESLSGTSIEVYSEEPDTRPKRCDWIVSDSEAFVLVECKTKRMTIASVATLDEDDLRKQLEVVAEAVIQSYRALEAYKNSSYKPQQYPYDSTKKPFITVVTLEDWYLMGNQLVAIDAIVKDSLNALGLDASELMKVRFIVMSVDDLESLTFLLKTHPIKDILEGYVNDPDASTWSFGAYLSNKYKDDLDSYKYVFEGDENNLFTFKRA